MSGKPFVPVVGRDGRPLMPCTGKRARLLLMRGRARVYRPMPFTIQLLDRTQDNCELQPIKIKIDPGSRFTGIVTVREDTSGHITVINLIEIQHRGLEIKSKLQARAMLRRGRRQRKTRYRKPRFMNRTRPKGWLAPSLMHRVYTTMTWVRRLIKTHPVISIHLERVKFDTQKLRNPEIHGSEYQLGELFKYEVKEYLLEKWGRKCAYCDTSNVTRFEIDHVVPRSKRGSDAISNLVLSCRVCNEDKDNLSIHEFLAHDTKRLSHILSQLKQPLNDAAAVNSTRNRLHQSLIEIGLPVYTATGAQTKYNRIRLGIPKTHALDAVCVGAVRGVRHWLRRTLVVKAIGHGLYQRTITDKYGFPKNHRARSKTAFGFSTGDLVQAVNRRGVHIGHVTVRQNGGFVIRIEYGGETATYKNCRLLQKADGYRYWYRKISDTESVRPPPI